MKFHRLLKTRKYNSFQELENEIEKLSTTKDKGDAFEDFIYSYLKLNSVKYQISDVFKTSDAPPLLLKRLQIESWDAGVDGVFMLNNGLVAAYQVKFRSNREKPSYGELTKFWAESRYADYKYTIANAYELTDLSKKESGHFEILVQEFDNLDSAFFEALFELSNHKIPKRTLYDPYDFQKEIIKDVVNGFQSEDRGKFISACGTGKTLTSLWITEELGCESILFLAPSLALIKQTLEEWAKQSKDAFYYLCVCSDITVFKEAEDFGDIAISNLDVPVTTDELTITEFLSERKINKTIIFSTYQSLDVLSNSLNKIPKFSFDIAIFDEAHRTAGAKFSSLFNLALDDTYVRCKKRLFMTATERMLTPRLVDKAKDEDRIVFSMDDETIYGKPFHRLNFGKAIELGIISDYRIVVAAVREREVYNWITDNTELENEEQIYSSAEVVFTQLLLSKAIKSYDLSKTLTFHSSINNSKLFSGTNVGGYNLQELIAKFNDQIDEDSVYINHIDGSYSAGKRRKILDEFKNSRFGIVSNSRCLTEGVDVPEIDSIYFVDPKNSLIDIVQAIGRALRKGGEDSKIATILIPILIPESIDEEEVFNSDKFESVYNIVQSLRDQDIRLEQWIDLLNRNVSKGKYSKPKDSPIVFSIPKAFDLEKFERNLLTRVAMRNSESSKIKFRKKKKYGFKERSSNYNRIFRTIGDYSVDSFEKKLIRPTIIKFNESAILNSAELKVNNNNISHTYRLGLIEKLDGRRYKLSPLGDLFKEGNLLFVDLFKQQMLKYFIKGQNNESNRTLYPYRAFLQILLEVGEINFIHFAYAICRLYDNSEIAINDSIEGINFINQEIPHPEFLNEVNQRSLLDEFNDIWGVDYSFKDIWVRNTTLNNQWIYFRNHLSYFDFIEAQQKNHVILKENKKAVLKELLLRNTDYLRAKDIDKAYKSHFNFLSIFFVGL